MSTEESRTDHYESGRGSAQTGAEDRGLGDDAWDLHGALSELVRVYQFRDRKRICYYDISVTQCYALASLVAAGPMNMNQLASDLYLDKSTSSRVVDALVRKGYASRSVDPADGRAVRLEATDAGRTLHGRIEHDLVEEMKLLIADLDHDVRQATARLIARLARTASERFGRLSRPGSCSARRAGAEGFER